MHVIKRSRLINYYELYPETKQQLLAWFSEAEQACWTCPQDILDRYNSADFPTDHHVIFDIKGKRYRLVIRIRYANSTSKGTVFIRWFGPHKDYDRLNLEKI